MKKIFILILALVSHFSQAQIITPSQYIQVSGATISGTADALANDFLVPVGPNGPVIFDEETCTHGGFVPGIYGNDFGSFCFAHAFEYGGNPLHEVSSEIGSRAMINGDNSTSLRIKWKNTGHNYSVTEGHFAHLETTLDFTVSMQLMGFPAGSPVTVYWRYNIFAGGNTSHEAVFEDNMSVISSMLINGVSQLNNSFNFSSPGGLEGWNQWKNRTGTFQVMPGSNFTFSVSSFISLYLRMPGQGGGLGFPIDENNGHFNGEIIFSIVPLNPPIVNNNEGSNSLLLFSVDIGSDAELSDPKQDGNEVFDPGDLYPVNRLAPSTNPVPWKNDTLIFGYDPPPKTWAPKGPAPVGSGLPFDLMKGQYFDLDGSDLISSSISGMLYGPGFPSIPYFSDSCIYEAEYLYVSFDDDAPEFYTSAAPPSVPVNSASPVMNKIYSEAGTKNEVREYDFDPIPASASYFDNNVYSEPDIHINLSPNPLLNDSADDDIDALDMILIHGSQTPCTQWYFTADHEAVYNHPIIGPPFFLDPATIYQPSPAGPVAVITPVHTGLAPGTDMRDFEFAWVWDTIPSTPRFGLAILFTVAPDDPVTADDETGGLDPHMIYYSFLNGTNHPYSIHQFDDPVDGLAVWSTSLNGTLSFPNPVWGTKTWTGSNNENWTNGMNWFPQGVPFSPEDVIIPAVLPSPVINSPNLGLDCRDLFISRGAILTISPGRTLTTTGSVTLESP